VLRNERATQPQGKNSFSPEGGGEFGPRPSLLTPYVPLRVCASFAPRSGPNSTRHVTRADFSDSLWLKVPSNGKCANIFRAAPVLFKPYG